MATDHMGQLLDDLLELSRTGGIARPPEDVAFGEIVREARALAAGRLSSGGMQLEVDEAAAGRVVHGDRARLVELMQNLLDNAVKFSGSQEKPRIVIGLREEESSEPVFTVGDNGVGIEAAHLERVFDLFQKLDPGAEGHGLGLALVRTTGASGSSRRGVGGARRSASRSRGDRDRREVGAPSARDGSAREAVDQQLLEPLQVLPLRGPGHRRRGLVEHRHPLVIHTHAAWSLATIFAR